MEDEDFSHSTLLSIEPGTVNDTINEYTDSTAANSSSLESLFGSGNASPSLYSNTEQSNSDPSDVEETVTYSSPLRNRKSSNYSKEEARKSEERIQQALFAMKTRGLSIRAAAVDYSVKSSTLGYRLAGREALVNGNVARRKFEPAEEEYLRLYLLKAASFNKGYSRVEIIQMACAMYQRKMADSEVSVGRTWFKGFMTRYPDLRLVVGQNLDAKRFAAQSPKIIERWIALFEAHISKFHVHEKDVYNFDETGFQLGETKNCKVLTSTEIRNGPQKLIFENREWVTSFECINTAGEALPPYIVFKGASMMKNWIQDLPLHGDWRYDYSSTGWTNNKVALGWLEKMFIPYVSNKRHGEYVLLVFDGHSSHYSPEFCELCEKNKIVMLCLPAHSSHILQPLDVLCFAKLKKLWREENSTFQRHALSRITKNQFLRHYHTARQGAFTADVILNSFAKAGLQPLDAQRVIDKVARTPYTATVANTSRESQDDRETNTSQSSETQSEANTSGSSAFSTQSNAEETSDTESLVSVSLIKKAMRKAKRKANSSPQKRYLGHIADAVSRIHGVHSLLIKDALAENKALRQELAAMNRPKRKYAGEGGSNQHEYAEAQEKHDQNLKLLRAERAREKRRKNHRGFQEEQALRVWPHLSENASDLTEQITPEDAVVALEIAQAKAQEEMISQAIFSDSDDDDDQNTPEDVVANPDCTSFER